eukprot:Gb_09060 [translate_table: standard]
MACNAIHSWTVSSLIVAFLELVLAFLLLWGASVAFALAKLIGIFGLHLPCACNDSIEDQNSRVESICIQRALVECSPRMISSVRHSVLNKFPFEATRTCEGSSSCPIVNASLLNDRSVNGAFDHLLVDKHNLHDNLYFQNSIVQEGSHFRKQRARLKIQDKETEIAAGNCECSSCAAEESKVCCLKGNSCLHCSCNLFHTSEDCYRQSFKCKVYHMLLQDGEANSSDLCRNEKKNVVGKGGSSFLTGSLKKNFGGKEIPGASDSYVKAPENEDSISEGWDPPERTSSLIELDELPNSDKERHEKGYFLQVLNSVVDREHILQESKLDDLNNLKQALRAEHEARNALYLELEKERNAAATAADEAMAMISRLQSEKASVEMEARQFKRMVEEKTVYDQEAIDILKEILVKRERETLALEDEVEIYRRKLLRDRIDKWERTSCNGAEEYRKESKSISLAEMLFEGETECFERQEAKVDETNLLSMDGRSMIEDLDENIDKLNRKANDTLHVGGRNLLRSFEFVEDEKILNRTDESQILADQGHVTLLASQASQERDYMGTDKVELVKPVRVTMDMHLSGQQAGPEECCLKQVFRLDEQPGLSQTRNVNGAVTHDVVSATNVCQDNKSLAREEGLGQQKIFLEGRKTFEETLLLSGDDSIKESHNTRSWRSSSCNENGLSNSDVYRSQITKDTAGNRSEDDSSVHDVHVVVDDIHPSNKNNLEDSMALSIKSSSERHGKSGLLNGIPKQEESLFTQENDVLMECNRAGVSSGNENWNPTTGEQNVGKSSFDLDLDLEDQLSEGFERTLSYDLRTKSMIIRDNARLKVEEEVECLKERLQVLEAGRKNLILSVESTKKHKNQMQLLEEIAEHLRNMRRPEKGGKCMRKESLLSSSVKDHKSFSKKH